MVEQNILVLQSADIEIVYNFCIGFFVRFYLAFFLAIVKQLRFLIKPLIT